MKNKALEAKAGMLVRKPVAEVFEAIVNPDITTKFWFSRSNGRVEQGKQLKWEWEMYGTSSLIDVKEVVPNELIVFDWESSGVSTTVEWVFADHHDGTTFVKVKNFGFQGSEDDIVSSALGSTEGFTIVLCALKAYLEHHIELNLVADKFPDGLPVPT
jgi:uncharacterized protein YndB with AHSA1/START domain